jgi:hypothetical protein
LNQDSKPIKENLKPVTDPQSQIPNSKSEIENMDVHHHRGTRKKEMERISLSIPDVVPRCVLRISWRVSAGAYNRTPAGKPNIHKLQ